MIAEEKNVASILIIDIVQIRKLKWSIRVCDGHNLVTIGYVEKTGSQIFDGSLSGLYQHQLHKHSYGHDSLYSAAGWIIDKWQSAYDCFLPYPDVENYDPRKPY